MVPCSLVELRQYTLHPGQRETLVSLFEREFIETQEAAGIRVLGQFEDLDGPDRFVWFRGFADMDARREGLGRFYGGKVWAEHRDAANATMVDSDDVLLLRPVRPSGGFPQRTRSSAGSRGKSFGTRLLSSQATTGAPVPSRAGSTCSRQNPRRSFAPGAVRKLQPCIKDALPLMSGEG